MKRLTSNFIICFCVTIFFYGCARCHDTYLGSFNITSSEHSLIPYTAQSKLIFINNSGDSTTYILDSISSEYLTHPLRQEDNSECATTYEHEVFGVDFKDPTKSKYLEVALDHYPSPSSLMFVVTLRFSPKDSIQDFLKLQFPQGDSIPGTYYLSLQIGLREFHNVHEFVGNVKKASVIDYIEYVYYTKSQGIVGFKSHSGKLWYLAN